MVCSLSHKYVVFLLTSSGGVLGFFCSHSYAHASDMAAIDLPRKLKGSDMVLFAVLQALGLLVKVLPVLEDDGKYFPLDKDVGTEPKAERKDGHIYQHSDYFDVHHRQALKNFREKGYMTDPEHFYSTDGEEEGERVDLNLSYHNVCYYYDYDCKDIEKRWKTLLMGRLPFGREWTGGSIVGNQLHPRELSSEMGGEDFPSDKANF